MNPTAYMFGEKLTNIVDNPRLKAGTEATAATYEITELDEYRDLVKKYMKDAEGMPVEKRIKMFRLAGVED
jgi:aromatic ring hydroxylase